MLLSSGQIQFPLSNLTALYSVLHCGMVQCEDNAGVKQGSAALALYNTLRVYLLQFLTP